MGALSSIKDRYFSKMSLKFILIVPFLILILLLSVQIGYRSFVTGTHAVNDLSNKVLSEMAGQGELAIVGYLNDTDLILNAFAPDIHGGKLSSFNYASNEAVEQRFWELTNISDAVTYVYLGRPNGDYVGVDRGTGKNILVKIKDSQYKERTTFIAKTPGDRSKFKSEDKGYDPLTRPWYKSAMESGKMSWAPLFVSWSRNVLMLTRSKPVHDDDGVFQGVVTTDKPLDKLSDFLLALKKSNLSSKSDAFIMESNGDLIATTADPTPYIKGKIKDSFTRIKGNTSKSEMIKETYHYIMKNPKLLENEKVTAESFESKDDRVHFSIKKIVGLPDLNWYVVIAAPESDFIGNIVAETKRTILYSVIALVLTVVIGLYILRWVTDDLENLTEAAERFGKGEESGQLPVHRNDEIGYLSQAFQSMMIEIDRQQKELQKYNAELERRVEARTKELADKNIELDNKNIKLEKEIQVRKLAQEKILQLFSVVELTDEAIMVCDPNKNVQYLNPAFIRVTGFNLDDMQNDSMSLLRSGRYDPKFFDKHLYDGIIKKLNEGRTFRGVLRAKRKNGEVYHSEVTITPVLSDDGKLTAYTSVERDVTLNEKAREELMIKLYHDRLTGLFNRESISDKVQNFLLRPDEIDKRQMLKQGLALFYFDLDRFKLVNDNYGHEIGDQLLIQVALHLKNILGENDLVARIGGDEFIAVLTSVMSKEAALNVAQKIEDSFKVAFRVKEHIISVGISIGVAMYPDDGADFETLASVADDRMYVMKKEHRKKYAS